MQPQVSAPDMRRTSLRDVGVAKLNALGSALGLARETTASAITLFDRMTGAWCSTPVGDQPPWHNDITDEGTPFEFSIAVRPGDVELRLLVESQRDPITSISSWEAGVALQRELAASGLVDLERFDSVADLFAPDTSGRARFSLWHAAVVREGRAPLIKAYLNPLVRGAAAAPGLVAEALSRLGLDSAWRYLQQAGVPGRELDMRYFALDLDASGSARVKIYVASSETAPHIERLLKGTANFRPGQATDFLTGLTGHAGPFPARPVLCCFAFIAGQAVPHATLHVPIRCYVDDDSQALARVAAMLPSSVSRPLVRAIHGFATRPLSAGRGLITYTSFTPSDRGLRVTAYLAPEAYTISAPRRPPRPELPAADGSLRSSFSTAQEKLAVARWHIAKQTENLGRHPLFGNIGELDAARAEQLGMHVATLALFVRDGLRAAQARFSLPTSQVVEVEHDFELRVAHLLALLSEPRGMPTDKELWPFHHEHESLRDWAYAQVASLFVLNDELSRLATIWSLRSLVGALVAATFDGLLRQPSLESQLSTEPRDAHESGLVAVARSERASEPTLLAAHGAPQHPSIERVATDVLQVVSVLERMMRNSGSGSEAAILDLTRKNA
jgi:hypothetical protein